MFEDIDVLENSVALLINRATKDINIIREKFIEKINFKDEKMAKVIRFTKNSTFKFNNVNSEGEVTTGSLFEDIYKSI